MIQILPLSLRHCAQVAQLHLDYLRSNFKGKPGYHLLWAYYRAVVSSQGVCGYVAEDNGIILGYVCGIWKAEVVRARLLRNSWLDLSFWLTLQAFTSPTFITSMVGRVQESSNGSTPSCAGYELRPIVVAPPARGSGVAAQLVTILLADAAQRGFKRIFLHVETDNLIAQAFYRKVGFERVRTIRKSGIWYERFERDVRG